VGQVYRVAYNQLTRANLHVVAIPDDIRHKRSHHSLVVDVAGQSTDTHIIGVELHVGVDKERSFEVYLCDPTPANIEKSKILSWDLLAPRIQKTGNGAPTSTARSSLDAWPSV
jgi:hypothetical protein